MNNNYLPSDYQTFIATSRYARWLDDEGRRETWGETVERYLQNIAKTWLKPVDLQEVREAILSLEVMPSMRSMMTAGKAADRDNTCMYNCSYLPVDDPKSFDEAMFILLCGTGVGFSVERQFITKLPDVPTLFQSETCVVIKDSKEGWAKGLRQVLALLWAGEIPKWDTSKVRPAGARLKTFGGRASGPAPLIDLFNFAITTFKQAQGRKLSSLECHDLMCKIGEVVVVGGVRRSAMISLSNLSDDRMRHAKAGQWWEANPQRALANNSACYTEKPDMGIFMDEWKALYDSKSGERGIFNRESAVRMADKNGRRETEGWEFGTNPCSEIILRDREFCNLSEVVVRSDDTPETLKRKVRLASILGTIQSTLTNFKYVSKTWQKNCSEERLLGVSLTGIMDCTHTNGKYLTHKELPELLEKLKETAVSTNKKWAEEIGIAQSVAVTCVKPSGTVSQLTDAASGIHARHNPFYIRTVRGDKKDPLTKMMTECGFPVENDVMKPEHTSVFSFPMKVGRGAVFRTDMSAIEQLELWLIYQKHWCEHKPSVTISVKEHEWIDVGAWVYKHFEYMSGVSFLPFSDHSYQQAPYQDCTEEEYKDLLKKMPKNVDWNKLSDWESIDMTTASQELACTAGACEIVDLV